MRLTAPAGFRFSATVFSHGWYQLPPFDHTPEPQLTLTRTQQLSDGTLAHVSVSADDDCHPVITTDGPLSDTQAAEVVAMVERCLNLAHDLGAFYEYIRDHAGYAWVESSGAGRLLSAPTVWEDLAKTLLTTNTTWSMTKQMVARLCMLGAAHGESYAFPTPEQVAALSPGALNAQVRAGYRGAYLHELALAIAEGRVDVEAWRGSDLPAGELYKQVRALKGFGDYAAGSVLRLLNRHDYLGIDSVAREMYRVKFNQGQKAPDSAIRDHYEPYGEWRGLMLWMDVIAP